MFHKKHLITSTILSAFLLGSFVSQALALTVTDAVNSIQWAPSAALPSVANPRGNIGYILANIFYGSSDGAKNGKIRSQYVEGVDFWSSTGSSIIFAYTGSVGIGTSNPSPSFKLDVVGGIRASNGLTVSAGTVALPSGSIDATEVADGALLFADWNQNGCALNQIPKWNGTAWACSNDSGLSSYSETDPIWLAQSGSYVKRTDIATSTLTGALSPADWVTFNAKASFSGATANMLPKFAAGNILMNSLLYDNGTSIGIGTTTPGDKLTVIGSIGWGSTNTTVSNQLSSDQGGAMELGAWGNGANPIVGGKPYIDFHYGMGTGVTEDYNVRIINMGNRRLDFAFAGIGNVMSMNNGYVGIGTSSPNSTLEVAGDITLSLSGGAALYTLKNLALPLASTDAANKSYVDAVVAAAGGTSSPLSSMITNGEYYSNGGDPYYCRMNKLGGGDQSIKAINYRRKCDTTNNGYCNKYGQCSTTLDTFVFEAGSWINKCLIYGNYAMCMGNNQDGQIGDGTNVEKSSPTRVVGVESPISVKSGTFSSCAILSSTDGWKVKCWGTMANTLWDGSTYRSNAPVYVSGLQNTTKLVMNRNLDTKTDWDNYYSTNGKNQHWKILFDSVCALDTTGTVKCWGDNSFGQLGNKSTAATTNLTTSNGWQARTYSSIPVTVTDSSGTTISGFSDVALSNYFYGYNSYARVYSLLGCPTSTPSTLPWGSYFKLVGTNSSTISNWSDYNYYNYLYEAGWWCGGWYYPSILQNAYRLSFLFDFSYGTSNTSYNYDGAPFQAVSNEPFGCAIKSGNGEVWCWGSNNRGQLGDGTTTSRNFAAPVKWNSTTTLTGATSISLNGTYACAIIAGGNVTCWGNNLFGQLGTGNRTDSSYAQNVKTNTTTNLSWVTTLITSSVSWGDYMNNSYAAAYGWSSSNNDMQLKHNCALKSDGTVYCWWNGRYGMNGNGDSGFTFRTAESQVYALQVPSLYEAKELSGGFGHYCTIYGSDNTVKCWGWNGDGQTLIGSTSNYVSSPSIVLGAMGVKHVYTSWRNTCLEFDSEIKCGGLNNYGQLGNGMKSSSAQTTLATVSNLPTQFNIYGSQDNVASSAAGNVNVCMTQGTYDGNLWGLAGADAICTRECGQWYYFAHISDLANVQWSAQINGWIRPSQQVTVNVSSSGDACHNWTTNLWYDNTYSYYNYGSYLTTGPYTVNMGSYQCSSKYSLICSTVKHMNY